GREFIAITASGGVLGAACAAPKSNAARLLVPAQAERQSKIALIDRAALVKRHNPVLRAIDPLSPLSVGNGEFAFTADVTGLQTFPDVYAQALPLCTMSQWGWHTA